MRHRRLWRPPGNDNIVTSRGTEVPMRHRRLTIEVLEDRLPVADTFGAVASVALLAGHAHAAPPPSDCAS